jgi:hypothetical protein
LSFSCFVWLSSYTFLIPSLIINFPLPFLSLPFIARLISLLHFVDTSVLSCRFFSCPILSSPYLISSHISSHHPGNDSLISLFLCFSASSLRHLSTYQPIDLLTYWLM